ncbi:MAG: LapA family protein [Bacteroidales bacterium]|nr:LapA family protein [Bacteroidales bacterium]
MLRLIKIIGGITGLLLVILFALLNTHTVLMQFFFWKLEASLSLLLIICFALGWIVGTFVPLIGKSKKKE